MPNPGTPILLANGRLAPEWFGFFLALLERTGGNGTPPDISALQAQVNEQGDEIATQAGEISDLFGIANSQAGAAVFGALLARIGYLERNTAFAVPAAAPRAVSTVSEVSVPRAPQYGPDPAQMVFAPVNRGSLGLGTMATQNANAVAVTGGTVDGAAVGATTASTGKFTTLTVSYSSAAPVQMTGNVTGNSSPNVVQASPVFQSDVVGSPSIYRTAAGTQAASFAIAGTLYHFAATQNTLGAGSSVANQYGFYAGGSLSGATANFGFVGNIPAATNNWNFYTLSTAKNYFAGAVFIGSSTDDSSGNKIQVNSGISIAPATTTTAPAAGGAGALPATPTGYATIRINGTDRKVAYY